MSSHTKVYQRYRGFDEWNDVNWREETVPLLKSTISFWKKEGNSRCFYNAKKEETELYGVESGALTTGEVMKIWCRLQNSEDRYEVKGRDKLYKLNTKYTDFFRCYYNAALHDKEETMQFINEPETECFVWDDNQVVYQEEWSDEIKQRIESIVDEIFEDSSSIIEIW